MATAPGDAAEGLGRGGRQMGQVSDLRLLGSEEPQEVLE